MQKVRWEGSGKTVQIGPGQTITASFKLTGSKIPSNAYSIKTPMVYVSHNGFTAKSASVSAIKAGSIGATLSIAFKNLSADKKTDVVVSKVYVDITYLLSSSSGGGGGGTGGKKPPVEEPSYDFEDVDTRTPGPFPRPGYNATDDISNVCFIYDKTNKVRIYFDGVIKLSINSQNKIQQSPDNQKNYDFVNNAMDQPDEITIEVLESDVYTDTSGFTGPSNDENSRSRHTYEYLYALKEDRAMVDVVTRLHVYRDVVLKTLTGTIDENVTNGWSGQLVFREYMVIEKKKKETGGKTNAPGETRESILFQMFGQIC